MTMPANMATRRDPQNANKLTAMACRNAGLLLMRPLKWLQHYYSDTMQRPFTMRQTLLLTETQLAFAATLAPIDMPLPLRAAFVAWCALALKRCGRQL